MVTLNSKADKPAALISGTNWNLEFSFFGGRKTGESREKTSEQGREPTTKSSLGHSGGRQALSPLRHPCISNSAN